MEDDLSKMNFDGRPPLMEDNLCWKGTFDGRQLLTEITLWFMYLCDIIFRPLIGRKLVLQLEPG